MLEGRDESTFVCANLALKRMARERLQFWTSQRGGLPVCLGIFVCKNVRKQVGGPISVQVGKIFFLSLQLQISVESKNSKLFSAAPHLANCRPRGPTLWMARLD